MQQILILNTYKIPQDCILLMYVSPEYFSVLLVESVTKKVILSFVHSQVAREKVTMKLPIICSLGTVLVVLAILCQILRVPDT